MMKVLVKQLNNNLVGHSESGDRLNGKFNKANHFSFYVREFLLLLLIFGF